MSSVINQIREKLLRYPEARVESDASSIAVLPASPDGFTVRLVVRPGRAEDHYTVYYNGSHEEFSQDPKAAIRQFGFGLSTGCRLREYSVEGRAYRWIVEAWSTKRLRWEQDWDVVRWRWALLWIWRRPTIRYLQNRLIDLDAPSGLNQRG